MNLIQPESTIKLPEDIQRAVEKARNAVTLAEQEHKRLTGLHKNIEDQIGASNSKLLVLEDKIASGNTEHERLKRANVKATDEVLVKAQEVSELNHKLQGMNTILADNQARNEQMLKDTASKEQEFRDRERKLVERENKVASDEVEMADKKDKLKQFLGTL